MKQFKLSKGWIIFTCLTAPLLMGVFFLLLLMPWLPFMDNNIPSDVYWILAPISIIMILIMGFAIVDVITGKFVIDQYSVYKINTFFRREFLLNEIKGYRTDDKYIIIESHLPDKKKIKISKHYDQTNELMTWLSERYPDLDIQQAETEKETILNSDEYGLTLVEREENLSKARKLAKILNFTSGTLAAWLLIYPVPYKLAFICTLLMPLICIYVVRRYNGLIRVEEKKISAYPTIFWAFFISTMCLGVRSMLDLVIYDHSKLWLPLLISTASLMASLFIANKYYDFPKLRSFGTLFIFLVFFSSYSYGAITIINCVYDEPYPLVYTSKVVNKRTSSGKTTSYYLELSPWGPQKEIDDIKTSKVMYDGTRVNDEVYIFYFKGRFDIPWIELAPKK